MKFFCTACFLICLFINSHAQLVSLSQQEINRLKQSIKDDEQTKKLYLSFEKSANNYLNDQPNPIDTIRTEGLLKGNPKKESTKIALADMNKMFALALVYRLNGEKKYLDKGVEYLKEWAKINISNGGPIDDTNLDKAIEAYDLLKEAMPANDQKVIADWLSRTAEAEINSKRMVPGRKTATNNWNAHRLKIVGTIGYALNNKKLIDWTIENLKKHIAVNLYADGTSLDFKERDAMHYHIYDLEPLLKLSIVIKRASNENFYTYQSAEGSSIKKSVDWLIPYIKGEKQHEEYVNTTVKFDRERAQNNETGFAAGTMFKPELALPVLKLAVYFDPSLNNLLREINVKGKDWQMVLNGLKNN